MAKRAFATLGISFATATAVNAQCTSGQYMALKAASATQLVDVLEILVSGTSAASAVGGFILDRVSTNETGAQTALASPNADGPMHPATAALAAPVQTFIASATNQPIPSNATTDTRLVLSNNAFGGILRWNAAPTQQFSFFGTATPFQECVLFNCSSAGGVSCSANIHIIYEPY